MQRSQTISKLLCLWNLWLDWNSSSEQSDYVLQEKRHWRQRWPVQSVSLMRQDCSPGCKPPNALFTLNLNFPSHGASIIATKTLLDSVMVCSQGFFFSTLCFKLSLSLIPWLLVMHPFVLLHLDLLSLWSWPCIQIKFPTVRKCR